MKTVLSKHLIHLVTIVASVAASLTIGCSKKATETHATNQSGHHGDAKHHHESGHHGDAEHHHESEHHETEKSEGGPNGGRLITSVDPAMEFIVQDDRTVQIQLLDENREEVTPTNQLITLIGGDRINPTTLAFTKEGNRLVSDRPLPEGRSVPVVLQIAASADAQVVREKFNVNLSECPTCSYQEYACICGHDDH